MMAVLARLFPPSYEIYSTFGVCVRSYTSMFGTITVSASPLAPPYPEIHPSNQIHAFLIHIELWRSQTVPHSYGTTFFLIPNAFEICYGKIKCSENREVTKADWNKISNFPKLGWRCVVRLEFMTGGRPRDSKIVHQRFSGW